MKRIFLFVTMLAVYTILLSSSVVAYEKTDMPIMQVSFFVTGNVSEDKNITNLNVTVPRDANYSYAGFKTTDAYNDTGVNVKLYFAARSKYYFRITKMSQIYVPEGISYISASREDNGYTLVVEVALPANTEFSADTFQHGWVQYGNYWYYRLANGSYAKEWKQIEGDWYYFYADGKMAANEWISGQYYVGSDGRMLHDTITPDGYRVGSDGKWIKEEQTSAQEKPGFYAGDGSRSSSRTGLYYWTENGGSYHLTPDCPTLKRSKNIYSGDSIPSGKTDPCNICVR